MSCLMPGLDQKIEGLNVDDGVPRFISMGSGVQTSALLFAAWRRYLHGGVIFADTGAELSETYDYIDKYLWPFCADRGIVWHTCRLRQDGKFWKMEDFYRVKKQIPIIWQRKCTKNFKIIPINRVIRGLGFTASSPARVDMGISADEAHRLPSTAHDPKYIIKEFPLAWKGVTRRECKDLIAGRGYPVPPKSGCDYCPLRSKPQWRDLLRKRPDRFREIVDFEENGSDFPKTTFVQSGPLRRFLGNSSMDDFVDADDGSCDSGHCFT